MRDTQRIIPMRGFAAAIASSAAGPAIGPASIAVGYDRDADTPAVALALRHADGTTLTAWLSAEAVIRLVEEIDAATDGFARRTVQ